MIILTFTADADLDIAMAIAYVKERSMFRWAKYRGYDLRIWTTNKVDIYYYGELITSVTGESTAQATVDNYVEGSVR